MLPNSDISLDLYRWTVADYHRLAASGILDEDARVELLNGQIVWMSPVGDLHAACVDLLNQLFYKVLGDSVIVRVQSPIMMGDLSEPEPDLAILKPKKNFYADSHPRPEDVLILIEVADTTLKKDRRVKKPIYAAAGIREYWILNLPDRQLEQHLRPSGEDYQLTHIYKTGQTLESDITGPLAVERLFPTF